MEKTRREGWPMLSFLEKILFEKFREMPKFVRVTAYLVFLFVFVYLLLMPRFIDGHLSIKDPESGKLLDYRGAELRMQVEGRVYKFAANEDGFWSIPVVSRLPAAVDVQVFHEDMGQWLKIHFTPFLVWKSELHEVVISDSLPHIKITTTASPEMTEAHAAELELQGGLGFDSLGNDELLRIRKRVLSTVSVAVKKGIDGIGDDYPLVGTGSPSYVQRIKIIDSIEKEFGFRIPDEHWRSFRNVGQLADYVQKRRKIVKSRIWREKRPPVEWPDLQESLPPGQRPIFRR
jgi:hypothetical protein